MLSTFHTSGIYVNVRCEFKALEDMSIEKQTLKERLERELKAVQETSAAKQAELISEHGAKIEIVTQDHKRLLEAERSSNEDKLQKLREVISFYTDTTEQHYHVKRHIFQCYLVCFFQPKNNL